MSDGIAITTPRRSFVAAIFKSARPKQWTKNVLVFAAPAVGHRLFELGVFAEACSAFFAFTIATSGIYYLNDALDYASDRQHPKKQHRPIASGRIPLWFAYVFGVSCLVVALAVAYAVANPQFALLLFGYIVLTSLYSVWLKHVAVVDLTVVAAGFVLRMIAGGLATGIPLSEWFLIVAIFSSLFVVTGKRFAEIVEVGDAHASTRSILSDYSIPYLRTLLAMSLTATVSAYLQWSFTVPTNDGSLRIWYQLTAVPWIMALMRYAQLLEQGHGGAPEEVFANDRFLQLLGASWLLCLMIAVYL